MNKITALTRSDTKLEIYTAWLQNNNLPYMVMDWEKNNFSDIIKCSSLLLSGGVDIFPEFYNDWEDGINRQQYIPERDGFEFKLLEYALENKMPVLGICRGMQLINCKLKGSLISDIETIRGVYHDRISPAEDRFHDITINQNSLLFEVTGQNSGTVNSIHHQAIDRLGEGLMVSAKAHDGIIEAVEWLEKENKPFLMAVQWHPERFPDFSGPLSCNIINKFILETNKT